MKNTLIFLHGGPGYRDYLKDYFQELESDFNCIFYDQIRGPDVRIASFNKQLSEYVEKQDSKIYLVGHSWGGVLAAAYTIEYPKLISGLALISTGLKSQHWYDEYYKELENLGLENADMSDIFLTKDEVPLGSKLLQAGASTWSEETFDALDESFLRTYDLTEGFSKLQMPILNFYGEKDIRFPKRVTESFKKYNPSVVDVEIKGSGHFPFLKTAGKNKIVENIKKYFLKNSF